MIISIFPFYFQSSQSNHISNITPFKQKINNNSPVPKKRKIEFVVDFCDNGALEID